MKNLTEAEYDRLLTRVATRPDRYRGGRLPINLSSLAEMAKGPPAIVCSVAERRTPKPKPPLEAEVQRAVLKALKLHPAVAWCARMNTGAAKIGPAESYVRFGFVGCSDIIGQLGKPVTFLGRAVGKGALLALEVKRQGGKASPVQEAFLERVNAAGGLGMVVRSVSEVWLALRMVK